MNIKAALRVAWLKLKSSKNAAKLNFMDILKRPVFLGVAGVILLITVTSGGYIYHQRHINYLNTSLRDSCGVSELLIGVRGSGEKSYADGDAYGGLGNIIGSVEHQFSNNMRPVQVAGAPVDYEAVDVGNLATVGMYDQSYAQGVQQLYNALYYWNQHCPNYRFVIAGYSQGADAVGQVVENLNPYNPTEGKILNKIDGIALIADPKYNPFLTSVDANPSATRPGMLSVMPSNHAGIRPAFPPYLNGRVRSWCRTNDPVCQATDTCLQNNPGLLTLGACGISIHAHVSEHTAYVGGGQTADAGAWLADRAKHPSVPPIPSASPSARPPAPTGQNPNPTPKPSYHPPTPSAPKTTTPLTTFKKYNVPTPPPAPSPTSKPPANRTAITSYDRMQPGAPHHGYFDVAWQDFVAQSNTITYLSATVGSPGGPAGQTVGTPLTLRLCTSPTCSTILAQISPQIVNYGETGSDIGDVHVTTGATYYVVWYQPPQINGQTWVTYWWAGGSTISTSDQMQAVIRGYNK